MMRVETKAYENIASDVFTLAYNKLGSYVEVAGKIGATGHFVSDVVKGDKQPTAPMMFGCLDLVAPWLVDEIQQFIRKEVKKILEQKARAGMGEETCGASVGYVPQGAEEVNA